MDTLTPSLVASFPATGDHLQFLRVVEQSGGQLIPVPTGPDSLYWHAFQELLDNQFIDFHGRAQQDGVWSLWKLRLTVNGRALFQRLQDESVGGTTVEHVEQPKILMVVDAAIQEMHELVTNCPKKLLKRDGTPNIAAVARKIAGKSSAAGRTEKVLRSTYNRWRNKNDL